MMQIYKQEKEKCDIQLALKNQDLSTVKYNRFLSFVKTLAQITLLYRENIIFIKQKNPGRELFDSASKRTIPKINTSGNS